MEKLVLDGGGLVRTLLDPKKKQLKCFGLTSTENTFRLDKVSVYLLKKFS